MMKTTVHSRSAMPLRQCFFLLWMGIIAVMSPDRLVCAQEPTENSLEIRTEDDYFSAYINGQMALRYKYKQVPFKPYIKELYTPLGLNILLDSPSDHVHHRGVMFAVVVDNIGFWEETDTSGKQVHEENFSVSTVSDENELRGTFSDTLNWVDPKTDELLLNEKRCVSVQRIKGVNATLLTWESKLAVPTAKKKVTLFGSHYYGLGMRFIRSMDGNGTFLNADEKQGEIFRGEERLVRSSWCAYTARAGEKEITVAMFDDPANTRYPATWFTMAKPFAYLSATMSLHTQTQELSCEKPITLRYGIALWDGKIDSKQIESLYQRWLETLKTDQKKDPQNKENSND